MAAEYRLVSYADGGAAKAGVLIGDRVVPAATLLAGADGIDDSCRMNLCAHARRHFSCIWPAVRD